jgi:hypothetical protein
VGIKTYADSDSVGGLGAVNLEGPPVARRAFACLGEALILSPFERTVDGGGKDLRIGARKKISHTLDIKYS